MMSAMRVIRVANGEESPMPISSVRRRRAVAVLFVFAAVLAAPASASAEIAVTLDRTCYTHVPTKGSQPIVGTITGGTPGADFIFSATDPGKGLGSAGSASGTFDAGGNAVASITDVFPPSGTVDPVKGQRVDLSIADYGTGGTDTPVGGALITNLAIKVSTKPSNPRRRRRVAVSGTPFAGKTLHGFITKRSGNHVLRRFKLGTGNVCGYASAKKIVAPKGFRNGHYRLYVNAGGTLHKSQAIAYGFRIFTTF